MAILAIVAIFITGLLIIGAFFLLNSLERKYEILKKKEIEAKIIEYDKKYKANKNIGIVGENFYRNIWRGRIGRVALYLTICTTSIAVIVLDRVAFQMINIFIGNGLIASLIIAVFYFTRRPIKWIDAIYLNNKDLKINLLDTWGRTIKDSKPISYKLDNIDIKYKIETNGGVAYCRIYIKQNKKTVKYVLRVKRYEVLTDIEDTYFYDEQRVPFIAFVMYINIIKKGTFDIDNLSDDDIYIMQKELSK